MHEKVVDLIDHFRPDILVITGHDAYTKSKGVKGEPVQNVLNAYMPLNLPSLLLILYMHHAL
jgi:hypothetical protein